VLLKDLAVSGRADDILRELEGVMKGEVPATPNDNRKSFKKLASDENILSENDLNCSSNKVIGVEDYGKYSINQASLHSLQSLQKVHPDHEASQKAKDLYMDNGMYTHQIYTPLQQSFDAKSTSAKRVLLEARLNSSADNKTILKIVDARNSTSSQKREVSPPPIIPLLDLSGIIETRDKKQKKPESQPSVVHVSTTLQPQAPSLVVKTSILPHESATPSLSHATIISTKPTLSNIENSTPIS